MPLPFKGWAAVHTAEDCAGFGGQGGDPVANHILAGRREVGRGVVRQGTRERERELGRERRETQRGRGRTVGRK